MVLRLLNLHLIYFAEETLIIAELYATDYAVSQNALGHGCFDLSTHLALCSDSVEAWDAQRHYALRPPHPTPSPHARSVLHDLAPSLSPMFLAFVGK